MSTPPPLPDAPGREQLLHPWSWLFVLLAQLRQYLFPLVALLIFGQRAADRDTRFQLMFSLVVLALLVAAALARYLTYRYAIGSDRLSVRSGLLARTRREIPFARIHNVVVRQTLLHRLFGVAELRLESAGSKHPEAEMRVLRHDQAMALEQLVRQHGPHGQQAATPVHDTAAGTHPPPQPASPASRVLLALRAADLVRLGVVSNRGMVVVLAAFGTLWQVFPREMVADFLEVRGKQAIGLASASAFPAGGWLPLGLVLLVLGLALTRVLSVALAFVQYHRFELSQQDGRLTVERGLFSRLRSSVGQRRIQAWTLHETLLHRWLGQRQLKVDIAAGNAEDANSRTLRELAPIAARPACDALLGELAGNLHWPPAHWGPVARRHVWRLCLPAVLWQAVLVAALWQAVGSWSLLLLCWLPLSAWKAWRAIGFMGFHVDAQAVMLRGGAFRRWWRLAETAKVQGLRLGRSPLDRLCGTASLLLDTAGSSMGGPRLTLPLLPVAQAQALLDQLAAAISRPRPGVQRTGRPQ